MQHSKVLCINCLKYKKCSHLTRMYVNYCGMPTTTTKSRLKLAFAECRSHRGLVYKYEVLTPQRKLLKVA